MTVASHILARELKDNAAQIHSMYLPEAESDVSEKEEQLPLLQARAAQAQAEFERCRKLLESDNAALHEYERAVQSLVYAEDHLSCLIHSLDLAKRKLAFWTHRYNDLTSRAAKLGA